MAGVQLGLGLPLAPFKGGAAPNPDKAIIDLDLWADPKGAWWDPTDWSSLYQTTDTSTPVLLDADPVRRISDKSGLGNHWIAPSTSARARVVATGAYKRLKYDGLDDGYSVVFPGNLAASMSAYIAFNRLTDAKWVLGGSSSGGYFAIADASASGQGAGAGLTMRVNGAAIGTTRQNLLDACPENTPVVLSVENMSLGSFWGTPNSFYAGNYASFQFSGEMAGYIFCPTPTTTKRATIEQWLAAKAGISFVST